MRYFISLTLALVLGVLIGEHYAPISGVTTHELAIKCAELEAKVELLRIRVVRLETEATELKVRTGIWFSEL